MDINYPLTFSKHNLPFITHLLRDQAQAYASKIINEFTRFVILLNVGNRARTAAGEKEVNPSVGMVAADREADGGPLRDG